MIGPADKSAAWFCLRSQPKHEHIAARQLALNPGIEVYLPRIRFQRSTRQGLMWFTEALFPNYLFARFDLSSSLRLVSGSRGVRNVVRFGDHWPTIPEAVVNELRSAVPDEEVLVINQNVQAGETVHISGGVFHGLQALVTRVVPGRERVEVLLEFLGRQTPLELSRDVIVVQDDVRKLML